MPLIDVIIKGAFDTRSFFAPATTPITAITGTDTLVQVTLQDGLTLAYAGTGLQFDGTTPIAGQITKVQVLRTDGVELASMDLTLAPWQFAEITTGAPLASYNANSHRSVYDFSTDFGGIGPIYFEGGDQADEIYNLLRADTLLGGGGDDIVYVSSNAFPQFTAPAGLTLDGGTGNDILYLFSNANATGADFRNASISGFETLGLLNGTFLFSGAQLGAGGISLTSTIQMSAFSSPGLIITQTAGRAVDLSQFVIALAQAARTQMQVNGTASDDVQRGNALSADILIGLDGNDRLYGGGGADSLFGGSGDDRLYVGDDTTQEPLFFFGTTTILQGGDGDDRLFGGVGTAALSGDAGNDIINGGAGLVIANGGDGNDWLKGGTATQAGFGGIVQSSRLYGGAGDDTLVTGAEGAELRGEAGNDRYVINHAGFNLQEMTGGGNDRVVTTISADLTTAGEIERVVVAATTGLQVTGTATNNTIIGNIGADTLHGGAGDDLLSGRAGTDVLDGGLGNDKLHGGLDADVFMFATGSGRDVISDFTDGVDLIDLSGLVAVADFADLQANYLQQVGKNVVLDAGNGDILVIRATTLAVLDAGDFVI
ncbi:MAG: hypothetical protein RLZZ437_380 [Pseudomonadota bacterium]|jgi:Ca2+-binding RTX toxin-like protein